ncbi:MAG: F0F1 ATP synthase subunit A [Alphaproteobacteria bacterium]|nr:F0F1 ATP synthase subunit A [Alphaproteobacteria bacterium]
MIQNLDDQIMFYLFGYPVNATLFYTWITMMVLTILAMWISSNLQSNKRPSRLQVLAEMLVVTLNQQIHEVSNDVPHKYISLISTFFLFIATSNILGIIPWFDPPTASLSTTAAFAFVVFCAIPYYGIKNAGIKGYFKKFIDPTPVMLPLNIISDFSSTFALAFRLYGNMLSGIVIVTVLMMLAPFVIPIPLQLLGLLTGTIQAYIFALLAIVYVSAVAPQEVLINNDTKGE